MRTLYVPVLTLKAWDPAGLSVDARIWVYCYNTQEMAITLLLQHTVVPKNWFVTELYYRAR